MSAAAPAGEGALARLVGDVDRFATDHWDRAPLHRPAADPDGFADVLSLDDCERMLAASGLRAPAFRLVKQGRTLDRARVTRSARIGSRAVPDLVDVDKVLAEVADGATLVLQGLQRSWPPLVELCAALHADLAHPVQANAYLTPPTAAGLDVHADTHDVLVVHTHGRKQWVVHTDDDGDGGDPWDLRLAAGDVLYLPRGVRHAARTTEVASLHVTIGVKALTWREVVRRAVEAADADTLDRALPIGLPADADALADTIAAELPAVAKTVGAADAAALAGSLAARARPAPSHRGRLGDVLALPELHDAAPLRRRPDQPAELHVDGDAVVRLADRQLRLPGWVAPALEVALSGAVFTAGDLAAHLDEPSRLVLVRRLVREGVVTRDGR